MISTTCKQTCFNKKLYDWTKILLPLRLTRNLTVQNHDKDYQYMQWSKTPTMHFQASLPRLPIPKLEDSCRRYLNAQKPLLSVEQLNKTETIVKDFLMKSGVNLHKQLKQQDSMNLHTSYISESWSDMYLRDRKPLPINYNPMLVFAPEERPEYNTQLVKATNIVVSAMRFMKSLRANVLDPEVFHLNPKKSDTKLFRTVTGLLPSTLSWYGAYLFKAFPLDMSQYHNLFQTTRIPQLGKDRIYQDLSARHIVVMRKGHFYAFNVLDENGDIYAPKDIAAYLKQILDDNRPSNTHPVGILTTSERDKWASARSHLLKIGNEDILKTIDGAVFFMILDDEPIGENYKKILRTYLHADGTNRWFDKSFSVIVTKDGVAGINFEHSWGDGVAVLRFFKDVKKDITEKPTFHPEDANHLNVTGAPIKKLEFCLDAKAQNIIEIEKKIYKEWTEQLSIDFIIYEMFGKDQCKRLRVSPDAVMQLAFQLALYRQEGCLRSTYESCSTAAFKHGRTETIRPCTVETKMICAAMSEKRQNLSTSELKKMIIDCSNAHNVLTKEAAMGEGFDRHLFALRKICETTGVPMPDIFEDPAYKTLNHCILSTSTLSSPAVIAGGFGPVVQDGYGIGYMIQDRRLGAIVTSYKAQRNASDYVKGLEDAFISIHKVLSDR
ncbi:hypothetical protein KM043_004673 [Ampulex compressa]|nr:hypothetical protein KM043_004673 [Ampulex compressa]